jgi:hypothetical protein
MALESSGALIPPLSCVFTRACGAAARLILDDVDLKLFAIFARFVPFAMKP